ncbi:cation:proton antiporter [Pedobacter sandarakinus]|uniref:cation:proton antiporter n=1 Tax=Pedobacter sandarakinus TaxID=353156 RepID=UPI002246D493|nr:cation:proton antiporter [Pedobacter sandarakinus]MCX2575896.1 cation:proton antiporter [Pedobacter sandarakinus]
MEISQYILLMLIAGCASIGMGFMPALAKRFKVSYSLIYVAIGVVIFLCFPNFLPAPLPQKNETLVVHLTELIVIISLMGTGIKIDRRFSFTSWKTTLRLIFGAMILCIAICVFMGEYFLNLALPSALLLGAVLAPTDPVLAADVQVGPPNEVGKSETKFALTSEAGLNDGMAFPFTWLAILVANKGLNFDLGLHWFAWYFLGKSIIGILLGWACGKFVGYLVFSVSEKYRLLKASDGFLAISLTLLTYALTELLHGYGFIAVFIAGITLRHYEKQHKYHQQLHSFTDQMERMLLAVLLIFFGGSLVSGILKPLNIQMVCVSLAFVLLVRPVITYVVLVGTETHWKEKLAISFFGIKGMGSVYYLAFALNETAFNGIDTLWAVVSLTILLSIIIHGLTATSVMDYLKVKVEKVQQQKPA